VTSSSSAAFIGWKHRAQARLSSWTPPDKRAALRYGPRESPRKRLRKVNGHTACSQESEHGNPYTV